MEQGHEIQRPSLLRLRGEMKGEEMKISVGGNVILTARGEML